MYTMLPCLALLALLTFWSGLKRKDRPGLWLAYLVVVIIGVFTHYLFAFLPIATALYLALEYVQYHRARRWGIAAHVLPLPVIGLWLLLSPGVRDSLQGLVQGTTAFSLAYKLNKIMPTLLLAEIRPQPTLSGYILMIGPPPGIHPHPRVHLYGVWAGGTAPPGSPATGRGHTGNLAPFLLWSGKALYVQ